MARHTTGDRRSLRFDDWPEPDRHAFGQAKNPGDLWEEPGRAARWSDATLRRACWAYGRWLTYLTLNDFQSLSLHPSERITKHALQAYVATLDDTVSPRSVCGYVQALAQMLQALFPERDWGWLRRVVNRLYGRVSKSLITEDDVVPITRILSTGLEVMETADADSRSSLVQRAVRYRDGLMLAISAASALRRKNLTMIQIGRHLLDHGDQFSLLFQAAEMKKRRRHELFLPTQLSRWIQRYLEIYRPALLNRATHDFLWVSKEGAPLTINGVGTRFPEITKRYVGERLGIHRVRHCLGSSVINQAPAEARIVPILLGHASYDMSEAYYIRGSARLASKAYAQSLTDLRMSLRHRADGVSGSRRNQR